MRKRTLLLAGVLGTAGLMFSSRASAEPAAGENLVDTFTREAAEQNLPISYRAEQFPDRADDPVPSPPARVPTPIFAGADLGETDFAELTRAVHLLERQRQQAVSEGVYFQPGMLRASISGTRVQLAPQVSPGSLAAVELLLESKPTGLGVGSNGALQLSIDTCEVNDMNCLGEWMQGLLDAADQLGKIQQSLLRADDPVENQRLGIIVSDPGGESWLELGVHTTCDNPLNRQRLGDALALIGEVNQMGISVSSLELGSLSDQLGINSIEGDEVLFFAVGQVAERARALPEWQEWFQRESWVDEDSGSRLVQHAPSIQTRSESGTAATAELWTSGVFYTPPDSSFQQELRAAVESAIS